MSGRCRRKVTVQIPRAQRWMDWLAYIDVVGVVGELVDQRLHHRNREQELDRQNVSGEAKCGDDRALPCVGHKSADLQHDMVQSSIAHEKAAQNRRQYPEGTPP